MKYIFKLKSKKSKKFFNIIGKTGKENFHIYTYCIDTFNEKPSLKLIEMTDITDQIYGIIEEHSMTIINEKVKEYLQKINDKEYSKGGYKNGKKKINKT